MMLQVTECCAFKVYIIPVSIHDVSLVYSSTDTSLGWCHAVVIVNTGAINTGMPPAFLHDSHVTLPLSCHVSNDRPKQDSAVRVVWP